ncbi:telomerase reverse transcriptase-like isoform X2 [Mya arenaria]|uniref:telomerase reverse transcriptase-like isoform X2 n=1 Tax=Mya arenaria TaxID=6604 RepID=UPI0022E8A6ED|nr:telomerase reverse transcriptase-like isoform X2 [Mya arenaria]
MADYCTHKTFGRNSHGNSKCELLTISEYKFGIPTNQISYRCVCRLMQRKKTFRESNILTLGYDLMSSAHGATLSTGNVESRYCNSMVTRLLTQPWRDFHKKMGDSVVTYLVEFTSLYLALPKGCYVQLTGAPLYNTFNYDKQLGTTENQAKRKLAAFKTFCDGPEQKIGRLANDNNVQTLAVQTHCDEPKQKRRKLAYDTKVGPTGNGSSSAKDNKANITEYMAYNGGLTSEECQTERNDGLHRSTEAFKVTSNVESRHRPSIEAFTMPSSVKTRQYSSTDALKVPLIVETRQYPSIELLKLPSNVEPRLPPCIESLEVASHAEIPPKTMTKEKVKANSIPCIRTHLRRPTVILEKKSTLYARNARERILGSASVSTAMKSGQADGMVTEMLGVTEVDASTRQLIQAYFTDIAQNLKKCPLKALLNKHCPVGKVNSSTTNRKVLGRKHGSSMKNSATQVQLLNSNHQHRNVFLFIRACIVRVVPDELLGGSHNRNLLLKDIAWLISSGKPDKVSLERLTAGMKTKTIVWMRNVPCNLCKLSLLGRLVNWIMSKFVFVLLRTFFYITETTFMKHRTMYFRQSTWTRLHILGVADLLQRRVVKPASERLVKQLLDTRLAIGVSSLRFVPKPRSLRPIVNMGIKTAMSPLQVPISINQQLKDTHCVLSYLKNRNPGIIGHGKFGNDDIYTAWKQFALKWSKSGKPELYFVKTDIAKCYDSMVQTKVYEILEKLLNQHATEDIIVRKYFSYRIKEGKTSRQFHRDAARASEFVKEFPQFLEEKSETSKSRNVVYSDKVIYHHQTADSLLKTLRGHVFNNIIKIGTRYYIQKLGISQGSVVSTLLCNFYYAEMEKELFDLQDGDLLIRIVDDYMFVSPSCERANGFLDLMLKGNAAFNCFTNEEKVLTNFTANNHHSICVLEDVWFPWCGLMFNVHTLEVSTDCSRYSGTRMTDSMSFDLTKQRGLAVKQKLTYSIRQKCHAIFVDNVINSETQVHLNIFHLMLLIMYKFHACARKLEASQRADDNPKFFLDVFFAMIEIVHSTICDVQAISKTNRKAVFSDICWLCFRAYQMTFQHKQCFPRLKKLVRSEMMRIRKSMPKVTVIKLQETIESDLPAVFHNVLV